MAVVSVTQTWQGRSGESAGVGKSRVTRSWRAKTDNKLDTEVTVLQSGLVPVAFVSTLPELPSFLCRSVRATRMAESPYYYDVEAEYSDEATDKEKEDQQYPNPLDRPVRVAWESAQYQKAVQKDVDGHGILNGAKDPFDPPPVIDDARWVIRGTKNVASVPAYVLTLNNKINDAAVTVDGVTFAEKTLKVQAIRISEAQEENDVPFRVFSYELNYRPETWALSLLNAGYSYYDFLTNSKREVVLADGTKPSTPQLLYEAGGLIEDPTPADAVFLSFDVYQTADLTALPGVT